MLSAKDMDTIKEQAYAGYPSFMPDHVCQIRPFTMGEYLKMGATEYNTRLGLLLMTSSDIQSILKQTSNDCDVLTLLIQMAEQNNSFLLDLQTAFATFITEDVLIVPKLSGVLVGPIEEKRMITPDNFNDFQTILQIQNKKEVPEPPPPNESEGARKMRLLREQRDAVKRKQQQKAGGSEQKLVDLLEIAEVYGIDYQNKSIYAFYSLIQRHQKKEKWEQDLQMLCAGADSKKIKPQYWGSNDKD